MDISPVTQNIFNDRRESIDQYMLSNLAVSDKRLEEATKYLIRQGGKRLRPVLVCLTSEMLGRSLENTLPIAASVEAIHTSSLIQDDLPAMDDDDTRRGSQAAHKEFGESTAILASNILRSRATAWAHQIDADQETVTAIIDELDQISTSISVGQELDMRYEKHETISYDDYISMVSKKTASIYASSARISGISADVSNADLKRMSEFGQKLGISFQIMDDVLDIIGGDEIGKDMKSDLERQKKTAVTVHAMNNGYNIFDNDTDVDMMIDMIDNAGSLEYAQEQVDSYAERAAADLMSVEAIRNEDMRDHIINIIDATKNRSR